MKMYNISMHIPISLLDAFQQIILLISTLLLFFASAIKIHSSCVLSSCLNPARVDQLALAGSCY
jgi:hypothetical protein